MTTTYFGEYVLDEARRELLHGGTAVPLTRKAYDLLRLLIERGPAAVSKPEIHERLWPDTFVSEVNIPALVFEIRAAIGDDPRAPRHIRTLRGFGYAFCEAAGVTPSAPAAGSGPAGHGRLMWADREIALREGENTLGRAPEAAIWIDHTSVSRRHARLCVSAGQARLEDLGSRHGTFVNGARILAPTPLADGARIRLGSLEMVYRLFQPVETGPISVAASSAGPGPAGSCDGAAPETADVLGGSSKKGSR